MKQAKKQRSIIVNYFLLSLVLISCQGPKKETQPNQSLVDPELEYVDYSPQSTDRIISRSEYANKLYGFWLGQCIANWTGLVTEMDKIGNIGDIKTGDFYTR